MFDDDDDGEDIDYDFDGVETEDDAPLFVFRSRQQRRATAELGEKVAAAE